MFHEVLKRASADLQGWQKTERATEMRQALSLTLMREVARQLRLRCRVCDEEISDRLTGLVAEAS